MSTKANAQRRRKMLKAQPEVPELERTANCPYARRKAPAQSGEVAVVMEPEAGPRAAEKPDPKAAEPEVGAAQEVQATAKKKGIRPGTRAADLLAFLIATPGSFDEVNEAAVKAGKFPNVSEARDWCRYVLRQAGELVAENCYRLLGRSEPITITKKKGGRQTQHAA
jgi:hypothetical protein